MKQNRENGFLLIIFTLALVIGAMAITTAFFALDRVVTEERTLRTEQKLKETEGQVVARPFTTMGEMGTEMHYVNEERTFPADIDALLANRYLQHEGLNTASYSGKLDAFGNPLELDSSGGNFVISSSSGQSLQVPEALYTEVDLVLSIIDVNDEVIEDTFFDMTADGSGLWNIDGTFIQGLTFNDPYYETNNVAVGNYELRLYQEPGTSWIEDVLGSGNTFFRMPIWIHPETASGVVNKQIRIPFTPGDLVKRKLTFNNAAQPENLANFPVLVVLDSSWFDYDKTQDGGQDLRFYDSDEETELSYEIEQWNESGTSYVWVKIPQIDASSSTDHVWMYYNDPAADPGEDATNVWNVNYLGVYHFNGDVNDSTANVSNGTNAGSTSAAGKIASARSFDGNNDYVSLASMATILNNLPGTGYTEGTVSAWVYRTFSDSAGEDREIAKIMGDSDNEIEFGKFQDDANEWQLEYEADNEDSTVDLTASKIPQNTWTHLTMVLNKSSNAIRGYINGVSQGSDDDLEDWEGNINYVYVGAGRDSSPDDFFQGRIDEFQISKAVFSSRWIAAQYLSMTNTFITYGDEEPA